MPEDENKSLIQDPEFLKLEKALFERQDDERKSLLKKQEQQRIELGRQPGITRLHLDDNYQQQLKEREAQSRNFTAEHTAHVREFEQAKQIREDLRQREAEREQRLSDAPKRTR